MRILFASLFASILLFSAQAEDNKARNAKEVKALKNRLFGVDPTRRSHHEGAGLYIAADLGPHLLGEDPANNFSVNAAEGVREGDIPLENQGIFGDYAVNMGFQRALSGAVGLRFEGGYRWMSFDLGHPTYSRVDFAPIPLEQVNQLVALEGTANLSGPRAGVFLDFGLGDSGSFMYVGSSIGFTQVAAQYDMALGSLSSMMDDQARTTTLSAEAGAVLRLGGRLGLRIGYEWLRINEVDLMTTGGSGVNVMPGDRHTVKVGIFHFFRRR